MIRNIGINNRSGVWSLQPLWATPNTRCMHFNVCKYKLPDIDQWIRLGQLFMSVDRISLLVQCKTCKLPMYMLASITIVLLLFCARRDIVHECRCRRLFREILDPGIFLSVNYVVVARVYIACVLQSKSSLAHAHTVYSPSVFNWMLDGFVDRFHKWKWPKYARRVVVVALGT